MSYRVEILCDRQHPRSKSARVGCGAFKPVLPVGEWETPSNAAEIAKRAASSQGWEQRRGAKAPAKRGWVCPPCCEFMDQDKEAERARRSE